MTDTVPVILGALPEVADPRDYQVGELYAALDVAAAVLPARFEVAAVPPITNQIPQPWCVTHSCAAEKRHQDYLDQGAFFAPDFATFADDIGTTAAGASMRTALDWMVNHGYPVASVGQASLHRIASYYSVPPTVADLKTAIRNLGGVLAIGPWANARTPPRLRIAVLRSATVGGTE